MAAAVAELRPKQLTFEVGGSTPDTSILKIKSAEIELAPGQSWLKGKTVNVELEVRIDEIAFVDRYDSHGNVTETKRIHVARMMGSSEDAPSSGNDDGDDDD